MKWSKPFIIFLVLILLMILGTLGFWFLEPYNLLDAFYMTTITLTTMGSPEFVPLSVPGRVFTIVFSWLGLLTLAGSIGFVSSALIEGKLLGIYRRKKMNKKIDSLKNHVIICGAGKIGKHVIREMEKAKKEFVVIDKDPRFMEEARNLYQKEVKNKPLLSLEGDPSREEILIRAGIQRAEGLIACLPEDAQNLFVALTAKNLNPRVKISSYVIDEVNIPKFYLIGTDDIISGDFLIGKKLTLSMMNHHLQSFLEQINLSEESGHGHLMDLTINHENSYLEKPLQSLSWILQRRIQILALKPPGAREFLLNPAPETLLKEGSVLILMGNRRDLLEIRKNFA